MRNWNQKDIETLVKMKSENKEYKEIGEAVGRNEDSVGKKFRSLITQDPKLLMKYGINPETVLRKRVDSKSESQKYTDVEKIPDNWMGSWSNADDLTITQMKVGGSTYRDIASKVGRTPKAVELRIARLKKSKPELFEESTESAAYTSAEAASEAPVSILHEGEHAEGDQNVMTRADFLRELEAGLEESYKEYKPDHLMSAFIMAAHMSDRDAPAIASLMQVPQGWINLVLNSLEYAGIWNKNEDVFPSADEFDIEELARIFRQDVHILLDMRKRGKN